MILNCMFNQFFLKHFRLNHFTPVKFCNLDPGLAKVEQVNRASADPAVKWSPAAESETAIEWLSKIARMRQLGSNHWFEKSYLKRIVLVV